MKRLNLYLCILLAGILTGCNVLPDEQFEKYAIIVKNGYHEWELPYHGEEEMMAYVSVALSGTSILKEDVVAELAVTSANLDEYNFDKFRHDEKSYYVLLPEDCYELESNKVTLRTTTPNACYFTTAYLDKESERDYYNINMVVNSDRTLTLSAVNADIELEYAEPNKEKDNETNIVEIKELGKDSKSMKFFLNYSYMDKSNPETVPVRRYIKGFLLREIKED